MSRPDHVETAIQGSANLQADHKASASTFNLLADRITATLGQLAAALVVLVFIALWCFANLTLPRLGIAALDPAPFAWLELASTLAAVFMTIVILASQLRAQALNSRRNQLILQLALSSDQKIAKIIALIEELRRDDPTIVNRPDRQAVAMAKIVDTQELVEAIEENRPVQADVAPDPDLRTE